MIQSISIYQYEWEEQSILWSIHITSSVNTIKPFAIPKISKKNLFVDFAFPIFIALSKCKDKSCFVALVLTSTIQNKQRINKS